MAIIMEAEMPLPRLELRWRKVSASWHERECFYNLCLPLSEHDIRREDEHGEKVKEFLTLKIGHTKVSGGSQMFHGELTEIDTPFRDGVHAKWDSSSLGNLPIYAVFDGRAMLVDHPAAGGKR